MAFETTKYEQPPHPKASENARTLVFRHLMVTGGERGNETICERTGKEGLKKIERPAKESSAWQLRG